MCRSVDQAIRWSNSPSLTPSSSASISAACVDERGPVRKARVAHGDSSTRQLGELHTGTLRVAVSALLPGHSVEFCSCHPVVRVVHRKPPIVQMSTAPDHSCVHKRMHGQMHVHAEGALPITVREELGWIRGESDPYKDWIKAEQESSRCTARLQCPLSALLQICTDACGAVRWSGPSETPVAARRWERACSAMPLSPGT